MDFPLTLRQHAPPQAVVVPFATAVRSHSWQNTTSARQYSPTGLDCVAYIVNELVSVTIFGSTLSDPSCAGGACLPLHFTSVNLVQYGSRTWPHLNP